MATFHYCIQRISDSEFSPDLDGEWATWLDGFASDPLHASDTQEKRDPPLNGGGVFGRSSGWSTMVVNPVRRAQWQRCMAACGLAQGDLDNARRHALQALHHLGATLPSNPARGRSVLRSWLALVSPLCHPAELATN